MEVSNITPKVSPSNLAISEERLTALAVAREESAAQISRLADKLVDSKELSNPGVFDKTLRELAYVATEASNAITGNTTTGETKADDTKTVSTNTQKIRIGNDICLHVTLLGDNSTDYVNIKSLKAYIVNTTKQFDIDAQHRRDSIKYHDEIENRRRVVKYISRFPAEPHHHAYHGTPYDLCHSGHPTFHVRPVHCVAPYIGFGVHPHTFEPFKNHLWGYDDMMDLHSDMLRKEEDYKELYNQCEFLAPVSATEDSNKVLVYFPAVNQLHTGTYKLVIIAKLYEPGYSPNNLRTVTMDYQEVFTLVGSSDLAGKSGNININIGNLTVASDIQITGDMTLGVGLFGLLKATVLPVNIDDNSVTWSIKPNDAKYLGITYVGKTTCNIYAIGVPEGEDTYVATVSCVSNKTDDLIKNISITITKNKVADIYTQAGQYDKNYIDLDLTSGQKVKVDLSKETAWYEGD